MRSVMTAGPKPTRPFGWLIAVLMRMLFALVIAGGAGTAGALSAGLSGAALEVLEESEDERPVQDVRVCVRVTRAMRAGASSRARVIAKLEIPRELTPTTSTPPPTPSWQRPRRTAPVDDDTAAAQA